MSASFGRYMSDFHYSQHSKILQDLVLQYLYPGILGGIDRSDQSRVADADAVRPNPDG